MEKRKQRQRKSNRGENGYEGSRGKGKKGNEEKNGYEKSKGKGTGNNKEEKGTVTVGQRRTAERAKPRKRKEKGRTTGNGNVREEVPSQRVPQMWPPGHMAKDWRVSV